MPKTKNEILTELYLSGKIQKKIEGMCFRNRVHPSSFISEDIVNETFLHLTKKSEEFLQELHTDDPNRLVSLAVRIAARKGFLSHTDYPAYPKHSLAKFIMFTSNLKHDSMEETGDQASHGEDDTPEWDNLTIPDTDWDPYFEDSEKELWQVIRAGLNKSELRFLDQHLRARKGRGRYKAATLAKINKLHKRIREIIKENRIHINGQEATIRRHGRTDNGPAGKQEGPAGQDELRDDRQEAED